MRKNRANKGMILAIQVIMASMLLTGCGQDAEGTQPDSSAADMGAAVSESSGETGHDVEGEAQRAAEETEGNPDRKNFAGTTAAEEATAGDAVNAGELTVIFGDNGEAFTMHLYENDTAKAVAGHVGTSDWRLPIYNYDNYEGWEYFQYYDIPDRYEIPSNPETITSAKAGEVYYSEPNRIILFYHDAELSEEYTPIGYIDSSEEFVDAVEKNPVLEGWGNKIVRISDGR